MTKKRYYLTFPAGISEQEAEKWLRKWNAHREDQEGPPAVFEGELCLPVIATDRLPDRIRELPGTRIFDNEARPEMYPGF